MLVPAMQHLPARLPLDSGKVNLTIRRISKGHHGRTLQMLGHAAEYLVYSRRFSETRGSAADADAIHILMRLSSAVFREYAEGMKVRRPVEDFVMGCASWLLE
jgi:hypothetical protein